VSSFGEDSGWIASAKVGSNILGYRTSAAMILVGDTDYVRFRYPNSSALGLAESCSLFKRSTLNVQTFNNFQDERFPFFHYEERLILTISIDRIRPRVGGG